MFSKSVNFLSIFLLITRFLLLNGLKTLFYLIMQLVCKFAARICKKPGLLVAEGTAESIE